METSWNKRELVRSTTELLDQIPQAVSAGAKKDAEDIRVLLTSAFEELKTEKQGDAAAGLCAAVEKIKALSASDKLAMFRNLAITSEQTEGGEQMHNSILATVLGDIITALTSIYEKDPVTDARPAILIAIFDAIGILKKFMPASPRLAEMEARFIVNIGLDLVQEGAGKFAVPDAKTAENKRSAIRAVNVPRVFYIITRLEEVEVGGGKQKRKLREVWEGLVSKTQEYTQLNSQIKTFEKVEADATSLVEKQKAVLFSVVADIKVFMRALEGLKPAHLARLYKTGWLGMITGDVITLLGMAQNVLGKDETMDAQVRKGLAEVVAVEQVKAARMMGLVKDLVAREDSVSGEAVPVEQRIVRAAARQIRTALKNPDSPNAAV